MKGIQKSAGGVGLAALIASGPAGAQVALDASSWVPPAHPITAKSSDRPVAHTG